MTTLDAHNRHKPTNAKRANDFTTKREVVQAIQNLVNPELLKLELRLRELERPWYKRLWRMVRS